jgi:hypothetical protein
MQKFFFRGYQPLLVVRKSWQRSLHKYCVTNGLTVVIYQQQELGKKELQLIIEHSRESRKAGQSTRKYY